MSLFAPLVFSSVVASMVSRSFFGIRPWYTVPSFEFTSITQIALVSFAGPGGGRDGRGFPETFKSLGRTVQKA